MATETSDAPTVGPTNKRVADKLRTLSRAFRNAQRDSEGPDVPEGTVWVRFSSTLTNMMADDFATMADELTGVGLA